jgi:hypothetical protein
MGIDVKIFLKLFCGAKAKPLEPVCMSFSLNIRDLICITGVKDFSSPVVRSAVLIAPMLPSVQKGNQGSK